MKDGHVNAKEAGLSPKNLGTDILDALVNKLHVDMINGVDRDTALRQTVDRFFKDVYGCTPKTDLIINTVKMQILQHEKALEELSEYGIDY